MEDIFRDLVGGPLVFQVRNGGYVRNVLFDLRCGCRRMHIGAANTRGPWRSALVPARPVCASVDHVAKLS